MLKQAENEEEIKAWKAGDSLTEKKIIKVIKNVDQLSVKSEKLTTNSRQNGK